jgi:hypothetical protein
MSHLLAALRHLGIYFTPARVLALGNGAGKGRAPEAYTAIVSNPPFGGHAMTDSDLYNKLYADNLSLTVTAMELAFAASLALTWFDERYPPDVFDGSSGDEGPTRIVAIRENLRRALQRPVP